MQPSTPRHTAKGFAAVVAATGFVIAILLGAPAHARHGGDNYGRPSATPTYDAWLAKAEAVQTTPRREASLNSVMTDASEAAIGYQVPTLAPDYDRLLNPGR